MKTTADTSTAHRTPADILFILSWAVALVLAAVSTFLFRDAEGLEYLLVYAYWSISLALGIVGMTASLVVANSTGRHLEAWKWGLASLACLGGLGLAIAGLVHELGSRPDRTVLATFVAVAVVALAGCWAALATVPKRID